MAVTAFASGTQTASIGTEHFVSDVNQTGVYVFEVSLKNMVDGDIIVVRAYKTLLTTVAEELVAEEFFYGAQHVPYVKLDSPDSNELTDTESIRYSIQQTHGTGRNFDWKVLKHA